MCVKTQTITMHSTTINLDEYNYTLPESLIAQHAHKPRDQCRLMILKKSEQEAIHTRFDSIIDYFSSGDVLVLNETSVVKSKLLGKKESGSPAEIIITRPLQKNQYECKIKTKNPTIGTTIHLFDGDKSTETIGSATIIAQKNIDTFVVKLSTHNVLKNAHMPSPPYIKQLDEKSYQTVFANKEKKGSLAAPTAGLHFTKRLLKRIKEKGVTIVYITLHVSYGTFKNIDNLQTHIMDPEYVEISKEAADIINTRKKSNTQSKLIVVGTTTLKALESAVANGKINSYADDSQLFIYPGYRFQSGVDTLITNFHLPKSSLILLTCAFGGTERILHAYRQAVEKKYALYSLGDAMMIERR